MIDAKYIKLKDAKRETNTLRHGRVGADIDAVLDGTGAAASRPPRRKAFMWGALGLAAILVILAITSLRTGGGATRYVTDPAIHGNLVVTVTATGSVQPTNKVDISSELSGTVRKVNVDFNDTVTAGQVLAVLDTDKLNATVDSSRAKLVAAKARVGDAQATLTEKERAYERKRELVGKQISSMQDLEAAQAAFDRAKAAVESAKADVGVAEAELALNETNLVKATITSPIAGVVLKRNVDPGSTVATTLQASTLFTIAEDLTKMEVQVDIDEADVGKVKSGQKATFSVDAYPEHQFPAVIRDVRYASETVSGVVTYKGILTIDNAERLLRPGMTATADIKSSEVDNALLVSNAALRYSPPSTQAAAQGGFLKRLMPGPPAMRAASKRQDTGPKRTLWILREGVPQSLDVVVGSSDGKRTQIVSGDLKAGDAVIVEAVQGSK